MSGRAGAVPERWFRLEVNGVPLPDWTASPGGAEALAAGRLLTEGLARRRDDLLDLRVTDEGDTTVVRVTLAGAEPVQVTSRPGLGRGAMPEAGRPGSLPPLGRLPALFRELYAGSEAYRETGGLHSAALTDGESLRVRVEDVARHSVVDRVLGAALLDGIELDRLGLVISARVSGEMARKCAVAGIAWIASRSVPTTLAVEIAVAAGLPIVARAAGSDPRVFGPAAGNGPRVQLFGTGDATGDAPPGDPDRAEGRG